MSYRKFFKNKKITVMGLGLLGRGLGDAEFLAQCGADIIVTDLKTQKELAPSVKRLKKIKNPEGKSTSYGAGIKFILGKHRLQDFKNRDMVLKAAGVPLDSPYIKEARKNKIPVEMDVSLFMKLAPEIILVGVTGTRGKSMTTMLTYEILSKNLKNKKVYVGGNVRGVATLPLLSKIKKGDVLVCELDSWQLQGFGEGKISPHISVFTSFMPDHINYYGSTTLNTSQAMKKYFKDKANIFKYQKNRDYLIIRPKIKKLLPKNIKSKILNVKAGTFQEENMACAVAVAKLFKISERDVAKALKSFKGLEGRLQYVKTIRGVQIYNDNNATTPEATMAGMEILSRNKNIILIAGGADKKLPLNNFIEAMNNHCKAVILIPGTGTNKLKRLKNAKKVSSLKRALREATNIAEKGNIILFSPAFASFGMFQNEYDRGDQFMQIVRNLK